MLLILRCRRRFAFAIRDMRYYAIMIQQRYACLMLIDYYADADDDAMLPMLQRHYYAFARRLPSLDCQ